MPLFGKFRKGKQIAEAQIADENATLEAKGKSTRPYKHVISHAAVDAISGAPSSFKVQDKSAIKLQWEKRRTMLADSRNHSFMSNSTMIDSLDGSDRGRAARRSMGDSWADRGSRAYYQSLSLAPSRDASRSRREHETAMTSSGSGSSSGSEQGFQITGPKRYPPSTAMSRPLPHSRPSYQNRNAPRASSQGRNVHFDQSASRRSGLAVSESADRINDPDEITPVASERPSAFSSPPISRDNSALNFASSSYAPGKLQLPPMNRLNSFEMGGSLFHTPPALPSPTLAASISRESSHLLSSGSPYLPSSPVGDEQPRDYMSAHQYQPQGNYQPQGHYQPQNHYQTQNHYQSQKHHQPQQAPQSTHPSSRKPPSSWAGGAGFQNLSTNPQVTGPSAGVVPPGPGRKRRGSRDSFTTDPEAPPVPDIPDQVKHNWFSRHKKSPSVTTDSSFTGEMF